MKYKHLIFDFDGVLAETNTIRFEGFRKLFHDYPVEPVDKLVAYAKANGGVSRYRKIEYFFQEILGKAISRQKVNELADIYSTIVKQQVIDSVAVEGSLEFLEKYFRKYDMAIVSGSDQEELREVCKEKKIDHYFSFILGSPTDKKINLSQLLREQSWEKDKTLYIGDSNNDLDAAKTNGIHFIARNSGIFNWENTDEICIPDLHSLAKHL